MPKIFKSHDHCSQRLGSSLADQKTLLTLYRTLICSKLDYGSFIYGSTRKSHLYQLNTILPDLHWSIPNFTDGSTSSNKVSAAAIFLNSKLSIIASLQQNLQPLKIALSNIHKNKAQIPYPLFRL